jgi:hypothetical protein
VDTDRFFARTAYEPEQAVPARPGAKFDPTGLTELPARDEKETRENARMEG